MHKEYIVFNLMRQANKSIDESHSIVLHIEQEITTTYIKMLNAYKIDRNTLYASYKRMCATTPEYYSYMEFLNTILPPRTHIAFQNAIELFWDEFTVYYKKSMAQYLKNER